MESQMESLSFLPGPVRLHPDIFKDLDAIQTQFHHMIRMIPASGQIIMPAATPSLEDTLKKGVWTPVVRTSIGNDADAKWQAKLLQADGGAWQVCFGDEVGEVHWQMSGLHNVNNGLAAIAAAYHVGVSVQQACQALSAFAGIKRRMELIGHVDGIEVYDDFAHHPTAITTTRSHIFHSVHI